MTTGAPGWHSSKMARDQERAADELIEALDRWEASGGVWRVLRWSGRSATVSLLRCDGGEEVDRLSSDEPAWTAFLRHREGSEA